MFRCVYVAALR